MEPTLDEINEEISKTHDLVRILCDTVENCRRNQRHPVYINTLCDMMYEQSLKSSSMFDEYVAEHCDDD